MATQLPDGTVVMRPPGGRGYPVRGGTGKRAPAMAVGGGSGARGKRVGVASKQPGRAAAGGSAYK
jgi:hypothetical protein